MSGPERMTPERAAELAAQLPKCTCEDRGRAFNDGELHAKSCPCATHLWSPEQATFASNDGRGISAVEQVERMVGIAREVISRAPRHMASVGNTSVGGPRDRAVGSRDHAWIRRTYLATLYVRGWGTDPWADPLGCLALALLELGS